MKKFFTLFVLLLCIVMSTLAQKNVIITIDNKKFTVDEFERIYRKNNTQLNDQSDVKTPDEYVDMFIDYKLKVIEAEKRGLDTLREFVDELAGYRAELAKPYLTDVTVTEEMIKTAYFRTINEVNATHILIELPKTPTPFDTIRAYDKIIDIRNKFLNKEKTFEELALEFSEDVSVSRNNGNLGYFSAFEMVTPFEDAAYSTPIGQVSMPFRTTYGYHILLVNDIKPSIGEVKVAHIMKMYADSKNITAEENAKLKHQMDSLYVLLQNGADFGALAAENSDDKGTGRKKGEMNYISQTFSVKEFANAAFALEKNGDYTQPLQTPFGWHIIKRIDRKAPPTFEDIKEDLALKVRKDPVRSKHSIDSFLAKKKIENGFKVFDENILAFKNYLNSIEGDTINEDFPSNILALNLYQIADKNYTVSDFWKLQLNKKKNSGKFIASFVLENLEMYEEEVITEYESDMLEIKYPEFGHVMQEYRDGMLLFSVMQEEVWNKATLDTIGFQSFYENNKGKYVWGKYFDGLLIRCYNKEARDSVDKLIAAGITAPEEIKSKLNKKTEINIKIQKDKWEKGTNEKIDYLVFGGPIPDRFEKDLELVFGEVKEGQEKTLNESRGLYLSDYQQELEKQWIAKLRAEYPIQINTKLLKKVKSLE